MRVAALLRRTHAARAAQDERKGGCGQKLMVSSGAERGVRRTMGDEVALADAVLCPQELDIAVDGAVHVAEGVVVSVEARLCVVPVIDGDHVELHATWMPAEAAVGLAPQRKGETRLGMGEEHVDALEG